MTYLVKDVLLSIAQAADILENVVPAFEEMVETDALVDRHGRTYLTKDDGFICTHYLDAQEIADEEGANALGAQIFNWMESEAAVEITQSSEKGEKLMGMAIAFAFEFLDDYCTTQRSKN